MGNVSIFVKAVMNMRMLCALAGALLLQPYPANAQAAKAGSPAAPGWVLDWRDEFDGAALDPHTWVAETGGDGWGNNELQYYTARPENVRVSDGYLVIEARKERYENRE